MISNSGTVYVTFYHMETVLAEGRMTEIPKEGERITVSREGKAVRYTVLSREWKVIALNENQMRKYSYSEGTIIRLACDVWLELEGKVTEEEDALAAMA